MPRYVEKRDSAEGLVGSVNGLSRFAIPKVWACQKDQVS